MALIDAAFPPGGTPPRTLAQGDDIDSGRVAVNPVAAPPDWRDVSDTDLEAHHCGMPHLDPASWRFYLPAFLRYAAHHGTEGGLVVDACVCAVRLPDLDPPRLATLSAAQRAAVKAVLQHLADGDDDAAQQVLTEYWLAATNPL